MHAPAELPVKPHDLGATCNPAPRGPPVKGPKNIKGCKSKIPIFHAAAQYLSLNQSIFIL